MTFKNKLTVPLDEGRAVDDFGKSFIFSVLTSSQRSWSSVSWRSRQWRYFGNWLNGQIQRMVISGMKSSQGAVNRGLSLLSMLGQILFNVFCNDLDDVAEFTLSNFADNAKLRGVADTSESHAATERDLEKLEK